MEQSGPSGPGQGRRGFVLLAFPRDEGAQRCLLGEEGWLKNQGGVWFFCKSGRDGTFSGL